VQNKGFPLVLNGYAVNPKNKHLLLKIGKDSMYYHVDAMFLEKVNRCLKSESLPRIAVCGEKFEEDKEGNSQQTYMGYIKDGTKNRLRNILNSSPAYYTLPTVMRRSLMRYFVSEKESYYC